MNTDLATRPEIRLRSVVLDCQNVAALSDFYIRLLGWKISCTEGDEWVDIVSSDGGIKIGFQKNEDYVPPVWPEEKGAQQQMVHLDFSVQDAKHIALAAEYAESCGAVKARVQYGSDRWITMIDPEGHPFCFVVPD